MNKKFSEIKPGEFFIFTNKESLEIKFLKLPTNLKDLDGEINAAAVGKNFATVFAPEDQVFIGKEFDSKKSCKCCNKYNVCKFIYFLEEHTPHAANNNTCFFTMPNLFMGIANACHEYDKK